MDSFSPVSRDPEWLTLGKAAKFLGVAQSTLRKWTDDGRVPAIITPGRHRRYRRDDLEAFVVARSSRSGALVREPEQPGGDQADRRE